MKSLILIAFLIALAASVDVKSIIAEQKQKFETDPCYREKVYKLLLVLKEDMIANKEQASLDTYAKLVQDIADIQKASQECKLQFSFPDFLGNFAEGLLLSSQCQQDLGGFFLIFDTILEDPSDVTNDIFATIFTVIMAGKVRKDCTNLLVFLSNFLHQK